MSKPKPARGVVAARPVLAPPPWWTRLGASWLVYLVVSLPLLAPCFWHSRIQAGDLGSHVYNTWLAQLVARGQAPGLAVVPQATNILFDLLLSGFNTLFGMAAAQRIAVAIAVLVFAWGAFAFVSAVAGRRAWNLFPAIAMLAYGWVFHMGFFNFYLSLGLCLAAMALTWRWNPRDTAAAAAMLALALLAHALPVAWALALMVYRVLAGHIAPDRRLFLAAAAVAAMLAARVAMAQLTETHGGVRQLNLITGADQLYVFDGSYLWVSAVVLALWLMLLIGRLREAGNALAAEAPFHFCLLSAAAIVIFPSWLAIPGYKHALAFIAERLSLPLAVCVCALVAGPGGHPRTRLWQSVALAGTALVFFGMLYRDEGVFDDFEDRLQHLVEQLPAGQRVVNTVSDPGLRSSPVGHMLDRVCVGHCYSYANYEPSTTQFRVRVVGPSPLVVSTYADAFRMETGQYVVKEGDLPLYVVGVDAAGRLTIRSAIAGVPVGATALDLL